MGKSYSSINLLELRLMDFEQFVARAMDARRILVFGHDKLLHAVHIHMFLRAQAR